MAEADGCSFRWTFRATSQPNSSPEYYSEKRESAWKLSLFPPGTKNVYRLALFLTKASKFPLKVRYKLSVLIGARCIISEAKLRFGSCKGYFIYETSSIRSPLDLKISIMGQAASRAETLPEVHDESPVVVAAMGPHTDLKLVAGGCTIAAHQVVIAAASPILEALLLSSPLTDRVKVLRIADFAFDVVEAVVQFIYSRESPDWRRMRRSKVLEILECATRYEVECLRSVLIQHLERQFNLENIVELLLFADSRGEQELKEKALDYISANRARLAQHRIFRNLQQSPRLMEQILVRMSS